MDETNFQVGTRLYDGAQLGIVYQVDVNGRRNITMPTYNDPQKDPDWIFNAERRIIYQPRVQQDLNILGANAPRMKVLRQTAINLLVNAQGDEYAVDSTNDRFRVHTLDNVFTPKSGIDPETPPPEIFTDFLIFESSQVLVANMSVRLSSESLRLIEVPVIDLDQEGATVTLFSSNRTLFDVFHPLYMPCTQVPLPFEPFRCFVDCFITRQCPRDCDVWQFAHDNSYHTAPLACSSRCSAILNDFPLNLTSVNITGREPYASVPTDAPPVPSRFLPMQQPKMYSTRSVPHAGTRMCLTKGSRINDGEVIRNTTAGLFSFIIETHPLIARSSLWSTVNLRTFSPSTGFFDSIINVTVASTNSAPTFANASVTIVQQNTPTLLNISALTQAVDADGDLLQFYIVDQPLHGKLFQYPSARSQFDFGSSALSSLYSPGRVASMLNDMLTSLPLSRAEVLLHPIRKTFPRAPLAHENVSFVEAYETNSGFQNLGAKTTEDFAAVVCGFLGVYPVEFEYEQAVFVSQLYMVGLSAARKKIKYRVLTKADSVSDALPHVAYDLGYRDLRSQAGSPPDIKSGSISSSKTSRRRAFKDSRFRDRARQQKWTEVYRGTTTQSSAFTSNLWAPPIAAARERSRVVRVEFCGENSAGPGGSDGRDFSMESGFSVIVAGGRNDRSTSKSLVHDPSHRIVYVPDDEFSGDDHFTVVVGDFVLMQMMVATIPLRVQARDDSPIAATLEIFIKASDAFPHVIQLPAFDADSAAASVAAYITDAPAHGNLLQFTGESISGTAARVPVTDALRRVSFLSGKKAGTPLAVFRYLASDGFTDSRIVTVTIHSLCSVGERLVQTSLSCELCPAGFVMPDSVHRHAECIACAPGYYQDKPGSGACVACAKGFEAPASAASQCVQCKAGHFAPEVGTPVCLPCPRGKFQPRKGSSLCLLCGSLSYSNTIGSVACNDCPAFSRSSSPSALDRDLCMCIRGYYDPIGRSGFPCAPCPYGAFCAGQQFPPVPYTGFYTDRRLWNPLAEMSFNIGEDDLDISLQYFKNPKKETGNVSSLSVFAPRAPAAHLRNTSLVPLPPASNITLRPPSPSPSSPSDDIRGSLDATISSLSPVFFACGLNSNPSACSGYPDTEPFFAAKMCLHRPVEGKCSTAGELKFNYTSTSSCAPASVRQSLLSSFFEL